LNRLFFIRRHCKWTLTLTATCRSTRTSGPYGYRAKIGVIVPPTHTVNEAAWARLIPEGVTMHVTRMPLHADTTSLDGRRALYDDIRQACGELAKAGVDVIVYACTAGSMVTPIDTLTDFMLEVTGIAAVATAPSLVFAARVMWLKRIALATPYHDALNDHEVHFFADCGIETLSVLGLGIGVGGAHEYSRIARTPMATVYEHCLAVDVPAAKGLIVSCTDLATLEALPRLEAVLGKPVISSNLATLWRALRQAGVEDLHRCLGRPARRVAIPAPWSVPSSGSAMAVVLLIAPDSDAPVPTSIAPRAINAIAISAKDAHTTSSRTGFPISHQSAESMVPTLFTEPALCAKTYNERYMQIPFGHDGSFGNLCEHLFLADHARLIYEVTRKNRQYVFTRTDCRRWPGGAGKRTDAGNSRHRCDGFRAQHHCTRRSSCIYLPPPDAGHAGALWLDRRARIAGAGRTLHTAARPQGGSDCRIRHVAARR